jgi:hypothetical protein
MAMTDVRDFGGSGACRGAAFAVSYRGLKTTTEPKGSGLFDK